MAEVSPAGLWALEPFLVLSSSWPVGRLAGPFVVWQQEVQTCEHHLVSQVLQVWPCSLLACLWSWSSHASWLSCWPSWLGSDLSRSEEPLWLRHGWHKVSSHSHLLHTSHSLHSHTGHTLDVLTGKMGFTVLLSLSKGNIQRLGHDDTTIHLSDSLCGLFRG